MTNEINEVSFLISALRDGSLSLEQVAERFRARSWPATGPPKPSSYQEMAAETLQDPRLPVPGSYDDVVAAYDRGELSEQEYNILSEAVAESKRARHQQT
jgi:hypothetical protein